MDECGGKMDGWMDGRMVGWLGGDGWLDGWMVGWRMDGWNVISVRGVQMVLDSWTWM